MIRPVRLQLSRRKGFNLQVHSHAVNGLPAIHVARPSRWGNRHQLMTSGGIVTAAAHCRAVQLCRQDWEEQLSDDRAAALSALSRLRGKNLACWCDLCDAHKNGRPFDEPCSACDPCHADVLLELANQPTLEVTLSEISALLSGQRLPLISERDLQDAIETLLNGRFGATAFQREKRLSETDIVDFWIIESGVAIEVKLKGGKLAIYRQCERYCAHDEVAGMALATAVPITLPPLINGKPATVIDLGRAWL